MTAHRNPDSDTPPTPDGDTPTPRGRRYSLPARILHWATFLAVAVTVPAGMAMTSEGFGDVSNSLYVLHKGLGVIILTLLLLRLLWRVAGPGEPELPGELPAQERTLVKWAHRGLYLLLGTVAVIGYWRTAGGGYPVEILDALGIPPLVPENESLSVKLSVAHKFLAYLAVVAIALHIAAVLHHTFLRGHRILPRMWPPWGGRGDG